MFPLDDVIMNPKQFVYVETVKAWHIYVSLRTATFNHERRIISNTSIFQMIFWYVNNSSATVDGET